MILRGDGGVSVVGGQRGTIKDQLSMRGIRIILQSLRGEGGGNQVNVIAINNDSSD